MAWHDQCPDRYSKGSLLLTINLTKMLMTLGIVSLYLGFVLFCDKVVGYVMSDKDLTWVILGFIYSFLHCFSLEKLNVLTLDVETTHKDKLGGGTTALPHFGNRLVSVGWKWLLNEDVNYQFFYHSENR